MKVSTGFRVIANTGMAAAVLTSIGSGAAFAQDRSISRSANGSTIVLTASGSRFAGAIASLTYRGVEYIDIADHGRQMQSATQADGWGECYNPNEAGSERDGTKFTSSSQLLYLSNSGNVLTSRTRPAYWLEAGQSAPGFCNPNLPYPYSTYTTAQNPTNLSNFQVQRTSRFYGSAIPNVIEVDVTWTIPSGFDTVHTEASTAYLPATFNTFLTYDRASRRLTKVAATATDSAAQHTRLPVIIAQANGRHAMGAWSPSIMTGNGNEYMAWLNFSGYSNPSTKWSCVFGEVTNGASAQFSYSCPIAVGTVDEVISAINAYPVPGQTLGSMIPVFRFYRYPQHFMTKSYSEAANAGFTFETTGYRAYASGGSGRHALYRCFNPGNGDHFVSTQSNCEGFNQEGTLGYASSQSASGLVPLYRFYKANTADHLVTVNYSEGSQGGYVYEGILGYVAS